MTTFAGGIQLFAKKAERNINAVFVTSVTEMRESIKFGSPVTGAPALPVSLPKYPKSGSLRDSVVATYLNPNTAIIYTTIWFAPLVEDDTQGNTFTNGGPHGWKRTIAAFERIVDRNAARLAGAPA